MDRPADLIRTMVKMILGLFFVTGTPEQEALSLLGGAEVRYQIKLSDFFRDSDFFLFRDHDSVLKAVDDMRRKGRWGRSRPTAIVHVDYHSDLYRNNEHLVTPPNVGNYMSVLISRRIVDEIWWIMPDQTRGERVGLASFGVNGERQRKVFWGRNSYEDWQFRDGPADQAICVAENGALSFGPADKSCALKKVLLHKRTNGDILSGGTKVPEKYQVILDIDSDFFDFTGLFANDEAGESHPIEYRLHYKSVSILREEFGRLTAGVARMGFRPFLNTCAMSPDYISEEYEDEVEAFFRALGSYQRERSFYSY